ncbi:MAG TPA: zinc-binding dehydrogenase, partial [Limnochordia bacterium]|nr:zinc-binding dehydrogenase [Limnochordia bacterium]
RPFGRMATVLDPSGPLERLALKNLTLYGILITPDATRLEAMTRLIEHGKLRPLVDRVLPLEEVQEAHRRLDTGHGRGKVVLQVAQTAGS